MSDFGHFSRPDSGVSKDEKERLRREFPGYEPDYAIPNEPSDISERSLDEILLWASTIGASDVNFMTNEHVIVELHGSFYRISKRRLTSADMERMTNIFYGGANGVAHIRSAGEIDCAYGIRDEAAGTAFNFRVNVTSCRAMYGARGIQITVRTLRGLPPTFAELGIEEEIIDAFNPENGLVLVCGKTGSGKSTLLAAGMRSKIDARRENYESGAGGTRKILTFESPIEYVYDDVPRASDILVQHEVPKDLVSFERAVRNSMRRAPTDILIGECRDYETISAAVAAAETGHVLYTTVHANSVPEALYRVLNLFPPSEQANKLFEVTEATRLIVAQKLVRSTTGGRVALREYLIFTQEIRDRLRHVQSTKDAVAMVADLVESKGQSMVKAAYALFNAGKIDRRIIEILETAQDNPIDLFSTTF